MSAEERRVQCLRRSQRVEILQRKLALDHCPGCGGVTGGKDADQLPDPTLRCDCAAYALELTQRAQHLAYEARLARRQ